MKSRQLIVAAAAIVASLFVGVSPVSAHASLATSDPAAGAVIDEAPPEISLTFTESVDVVPNSIRLIAADGTVVDIGSVNQNLGAGSLTASLPDLADGTYVVAWKAVSADSHPISGTFIFSVGVATDVAPGLVDGLVDEQSTRSTPELWLGFGRWMSFVGIAALAGGLFVLLACARHLLGGRRARNTLLAAGLVATVGTLVMIGAQSSLTTGSALSSSGWVSVFDSNAGRWWFARLGAVAMLLVLVLTRRHAANGRWRAAGAAVGLATFAVYAAGGHAVSGRARGLGFAATVGHLTAMSIWSGGLVVLVVIVRRAEFWSAATRFSALALGSVVLLATTGAVNGWRQLGTLSGFTDSTYGRWLLVKLVLVVVVVSVAGASRWLVRVSTKRATASEASSEAEVGTSVDGALPEPGVDASAGLRRCVVVELVGVVLILAATAGLVNASPPKVVTTTGPVSVSVVEGERIAQVILDPAVTGGTTMHVYISSTSGVLDQPDQITVEASLPAQQIGSLLIPMLTAGPDHVTTNTANIPLAGLWTFTITVRYGDFDQVVFTAQLEVR